MLATVAAAATLRLAIYLGVADLDPGELPGPWRIALGL
jgi:hypothetical protein